MSIACLFLFLLPFQAREQDVGSLIEKLGSKDRIVSSGAKYELLVYGPEAVHPLLRSWQLERSRIDRADLRISIAELIGDIGAELVDPASDVIKEAVNGLVEIVETDANEGVRIAAIRALSKQKGHRNTVVRTLEKAAIATNFRIRLHSVLALGDLRGDAKPAVPTIRVRLKEDRELEVRTAAAESLGKIGAVAEPAIPDLIDALDDSDIRAGAVADSIAQIAYAVEAAGATESLDHFRTAQVKLQTRGFSQQSDELGRAVAHLETTQHNLFVRVVLRLISVTWIRVTIVFYAGLALLWVLFLLRWPLALPKINHGLELDSGVKVGIVELKVPLNYIFLVRAFCFTRRVLNKWTQRNRNLIKELFFKQCRVQPLEPDEMGPSFLDGQRIAKLSPQDLRPAFERKRFCLLIVGDEANLRTRWAVTIANWAMCDERETRLCNHLIVPVLVVSSDLDLPETSGKAFIQAISGRLRAAIGDLTDPKLLDHLLKSKRVLMVLDGLSEMNREARSKLRPEREDFGVNGLIVTSRLDEELGQVPRTKVEIR